MLRLHEHFLKHTIITTIFAVLIIGISSYIILKYVQIKSYENLLQTAIKTAKISINEEKNLEDFTKKFGDETKIRMSIIDDNGIVIADSFNDINTLENHNNRAEIIEARKQEFGIVTRYSQTAKSDFLYIASKIKLDEKPYFLRLSIDLKSIMNSFYILWINASLLLILFMIILFFWSNRFSKKIKNELKNINLNFNDIANKEYDNTYNFGFAKEFVEIGLYLKKLSKRLQKRDKQKKKYTTKLKLANRQKNDVISAISHEFKNPIATIIGYAQTLHEEKNLDIKTREKFLEKIVKNSQKVSDMIDRLSLATKLESDDIELQFKRFDIHETIKEIIQTYKITKPDRIINYVGEETFVDADEQMMELVIINLIDNALKYSELDVDISLKNREFFVQDYGIGIEENEIEKVTNKFYRSNTKSFDNSMGLGLNFVRLILKMHDTKLEIKSEINVGSIFSFKLN